MQANKEGASLSQCAVTMAEADCAVKKIAERFNVSGEIARKIVRIAGIGLKTREQS
ncbi:MAG TPA: hypothetical protein VGU01_03420 [Sphingomicrobium sp.]|nr:hypothetical protein [Sphingomicrobium sp.]